jgi:hypothetical protein
VKPISDAHASGEPFIEIKSYPLRFFVKTTAHDRQGKVRVWLVGISTFERDQIESAE